jgi:hypothetical protein
MRQERKFEHWMPDLVDLSESFYKGKINHRAVIYHKINFKAVDELYKHAFGVVEKEMYPEYIIRDDSMLDRHKIVAIYILAFLKNKLFTDGDEPRLKSCVDKLANEHFCLVVLKVILEAWQENDGRICEIRIPEEYEQCLIKIFYKYTKSPLYNSKDTTFIYALANIVYFVEKCYLTVTI